MDKETLKAFAARAREVLLSIAQPTGARVVRSSADMTKGPIDEELRDIAAKLSAAVDAIDRYVQRRP
jgi:hypothetical protein